MKPSKYLKAFSQSPTDVFKVYGDTLIVERVAAEDKKTSSGLIIPVESKLKQIGTISQDLPEFVHVLRAGAGFYDEATGEDIPPSVSPGDIILVGKLSVKWLSWLDIDGYEPFDIGLTRESEIQLHFKGIEGYQKYFDSINKSLKS